jgi:four helix bundle protein
MGMNYNTLDVYKLASMLFPEVYRLVRTWDWIDQRELGSQMIRAANSIHANVAEGSNKSAQEFKRYLTTAIGSCDELISHITDAGNVQLIDTAQKQRLLDQYTIVGKQLMQLRKNWH